MKIMSIKKSRVGPKAPPLLLRNSKGLITRKVRLRGSKVHCSGPRKDMEGALNAYRMTRPMQKALYTDASIHNNDDEDNEHLNDAEHITIRHS